ncbi:flagellar hook-basal body complex protein FliE, partial [Ralstonia sp. VS2407]
MSIAPTGLKPLGMSPAGAANAYGRVASGGMPEGGGFGQALSRAMEGVVDAGKHADAQSMKAISGGGNLTEVVTAVSHAELALQSAVAVRDPV